VLEREIGYQDDGNALEVCVTETGEEGLGCQTLSIQDTATPFEHRDQISLIVWPKNCNLASICGHINTMQAQYHLLCQLL
jgi:hypothetical protein